MLVRMPFLPSVLLRGALSQSGATRERWSSGTMANAREGALSELLFVRLLASCARTRGGRRPVGTYFGRASGILAAAKSSCCSAPIEGILATRPTSLTLDLVRIGESSLHENSDLNTPSKDPELGRGSRKRAAHQTVSDHKCESSLGTWSRRKDFVARGQLVIQHANSIPCEPAVLVAGGEFQVTAYICGLQC